MGSCDLLSNSFYQIFDNNVERAFAEGSPVVICFQILFIRSLITTKNILNRTITSCDLLSNSFYQIFDNNAGSTGYISQLVVICFQILFIRSLITTEVLQGIADFWL